MNKKLLLPILVLTFLLLSIGLGSATDYVEGTGQTLINDAAATITAGVSFKVNLEGIYFSNVTRSGTELNRAALYYRSNSSLIATSTNIVGDTIYFENIPLTQGTEYSIVLDKTGSSYFVRRSGIVSYPFNKVAVNFTNGVGGASYPTLGPIITDRVYNVFNIGLTDSHFATITAKDVYDSTSINNFSVSWNGSTYSTTNGTVSLPTTVLDANLYNITFFDVEDNGGYFNRTYTNYNFRTSGNLEAELYQAVLDMDAYEKITGTQLTGNFTSGTQNDPNTLYMKAGTYNITFVNSSYYNKTEEFTIVPYQNDTQNITGVYNSIINITAKHLYDNATLSNFTGWVSNTDNSYNETYTTTNGTALINTIQNLNYTAYINATGYTTQDTNNYATLNPTTTTLNKTFQLNKENSFYIYARDIFTNELLDNVSIFLYGPSTYNFTFNQELYNYSLTTGFYDVVVSKDTYSDAIGSLTINNEEMANQTFYLSASSQNVVIYVRNIYNQYLQDANVQIIRKFDDAVVAQDITDFSGAVSFNLVPTLNYYINITADGYQNYYENFNVIESTYTITLNLDEETVPSYYTGLNYSFNPKGVFELVNNTDHNITFAADSQGTWTFTDCYLFLIGKNESANTTLYNASGSCSGLSASITYEINTNSYDLIEAYGILEINSTANITYKNFYSIGNYYEGDYSLSNALTSLNNFDKAGFGKFGKYLLMAIITISIILSAVKVKYLSIDKTTGTGVIILLWLITAIFSYSGFFTLEFIPIPFLQQWGLTVFLGYFMIGIIFEVGN